MNILLFGVPNIGKSTTAKILANKLGYVFYDIDEEVKKRYRITLEEFVNTGTIRERDAKRGDIIYNLVNDKMNKVVAVSPISYSEVFEEILENDDVLAIVLEESVENIYDRLVFSDENDCIYKDDDYKNAHKSYYLNDILEDQKWYGSVYSIIKNKYHMENALPDEVAEGIIKKYQL